MKKSIDSYWKLVSAYCDVLKKSGCDVTFDTTKCELYKKTVEHHYKEYKEKYMDVAAVEHLDRHKIAAVFVASGLECDIIKQSDSVKEGSIYIGAQKILLLAAFDYLLAKMNEILKKNNSFLKPMETMHFPNPWSCETNYVDVFSRSLYYEKRESGKVNIMELAEKFFLLEYISIQDCYKENAGNVFEALRQPGENYNGENQ